MRIQLSMDPELPRKLRELLEHRLPDSRERFVETVMDETLAVTSSNNPVATGRSRAAWDAARMKLSTSGNSSSSSEGHLNRTTAADTTELQATNLVPYISYLEYGTSKTAPVAMVRRALMQMAQSAGSLFTLE